MTIQQRSIPIACFLLSLIMFAVPAAAAPTETDCVVDGGKAHCTEPEIVPPSGRPDSDADGDKFIYFMCDEAAPYTFRYRFWCESASGTWTGAPGQECVSLPDVVVGGAGTMVKAESAVDQFSKSFEEKVLRPCEDLTESASGWGGSNGNFWCGSLPRITRNGFIVDDGRHTDYSTPNQLDGNVCVSRFVQERVVMRRLRDLKCPAGYEQRNVPGTNDILCVRKEGEYCPTVGNPIAQINGAKLQTETDYRSGGFGGLEFERHYNSQGYFRLRHENNPPTPVGHLWRHTYQRTLHFYTDQTYAIGAAHRPNGYVLHFDTQGREIHNRGDGGAARLVAVPPVGTPGPDTIAWKLTLNDDSVERYDAAGRLRSISTRAGVTTTLTWSTQGLLTEVTDQFGRKLAFAYNTDGRITTVTQPDNEVIAYTYDEWGRLAAVTYPGNAMREYHYENTTYPKLLTGITDENNNRYATYGYNSLGMATSTEHAGGVDKYQLVYNGYYPAHVVTDPLGTSRGYTYVTVNGMSKIASASQPCTSCGSNNFQGITYDANGNVASRTDFNGNRTNYVYDPTRNLETSRTEGLKADGSATSVSRTITTQWHPTYRLPTKVTEPDGNGGTRVTDYTYDANGNLLQRKISAGVLSRIWNYTVDGYGRVLTEDGPRTDVSDVSTFAYYSGSDSCAECRGQIRTITNALGHSTTFDLYDANRNLAKIVDPNGVVRTMSYTPRNWLISKTDAFGTSASETSTFSYDDTGALKRITKPDGSFFDYAYDAAQRPTKVLDGAGNVLRFSLNNAGDRTLFEALNPQNEVRWSRGHTYDALGRISTQTDAYSQAYRFHYRANGALGLSIDPQGNAKSSEYDELNRLVGEIDSGGSAASYAFDSANNLREVTDPNGLSTSFQFDGLGNPTAMASPTAGGAQRTFDEAGNPQSFTDARGIVTNYEFDALNRVTRAIHGSGQDAIQVTYAYDQGENGVGRPTSVERGESRVTYTYDKLGRISAKTEIVNSNATTITYTYQAGRLSMVTTPGGRTISYSYDQVGNVRGIAIDGTQFLDGATYQPFGQNEGFQFSHGAGVKRSRDMNGRIVELTLGPTSATAGSTTYAYDARDQLIYAGGGGQAWAYSYDANGNRAAATKNGLVSNYVYQGGTGRLASVTGVTTTTLTYDANGSQIGRGSETFRYDASGRLAGYTNGSSYTYSINGLGERIRKIGGGKDERFMYDVSGKLIGEYRADGSAVREYLYLDEVPVGFVDQDQSGNTEKFAIYADRTGGVRSIEKVATGEVVWTWHLSDNPFGNDSPNQDPDNDGISLVCNLRFAGQYFDVESGLNYNYYRDYDPALGRYIQNDPIGLRGGLQTYGYVGQNPLRYSDPRGLSMVECALSGRGCSSQYFVPPPRRPKCNCLRAPDFILFDFDAYVFSFSATFTRHGDAYLGGGVNRSYPKPTGFGASMTDGWMLVLCEPTREQINNFLEGPSGGFMIFYGVGGGYMTNPSGSAITVGTGVGISVGGGYNWSMGNVFGEQR